MRFITRHEPAGPRGGEVGDDQPVSEIARKRVNAFQEFAASALNATSLEAVLYREGAPRAPGSFWIELPAADSPLEGLPKCTDILALGGASSAEPGKVLYIEDNLSNLTLVEQMLAEQPHIRLITAMQGGLGLDLARLHLPDLILLDLHLPDLPGHKVLARLQQDELTREIPVVIISADATARQIERLMAAGARSYLTKPLDIADFFEVIDETIRERKCALEFAAV